MLWTKVKIKFANQMRKVWTHQMCVRVYILLSAHNNSNTNGLNLHPQIHWII